MIGLYAIGAVGLWDKLTQTFALVLVATVFAIIIGIPIGILAARNRVLRRILTPILDVMQTLPSFVYLIPVLMFFGLGKVPALGSEARRDGTGSTSTCQVWWSRVE